MNNSNTAKKKANATVITGSRTRLSFPHLFEPQGLRRLCLLQKLRLCFQMSPLRCVTHHPHQRRENQTCVSLLRILRTL